MSLTMVEKTASQARGTTRGAVPTDVRDHSTESSGCVPLKLHFDPQVEDPRRRYGMSQLLRFLGIRHVESSSPDDGLYYGLDSKLGRRAAIWIHADSQWNGRIESTSGSEAVRDHGDSRANGNAINFDLARAVFALLTLEDERARTDRDAHGRVNGRGNPPAGDAKPPIHTHIEILKRAIADAGLHPATRPRWPKGARFAACLTHDVDDPERPRSMGRLMRSFLTPGNPSRRADYWRMRTEIKTRGFYDACLAPATRRREWDFHDVCEFERQCGFRSAFYFAVVNRTRGHACDVTYDAALSRYRRLFETLKSGGWEVGLHAAYATKDAAEGIAPQVQRLNALTGDTVRGVRHHYLQVDHECPDRSLMDHADAGLQYDTSIGFNDCPGFRAGVALPYQPYDAKRGAARDFVELPLTIADMHLPKDDVARAVGMVIDHLHRVRGLGGLAVLDWHVGHWHTAPAWRAAYVAACEFLAADKQAFVATPRDIATWWLGDT